MNNMNAMEARRIMEKSFPTYDDVYYIIEDEAKKGNDVAFDASQSQVTITW